MADAPKDQPTLFNGTQDAPPVVAAVEPSAEAAAPVVAAEPALEVKPVSIEAKPELTTDKPSLLETFEQKEEPKGEVKAEVKAESDKPAEPKSGDDKPKAEADKPKTEADKPAAEVVAAEPATPEPVAYEYTIPETLKLDDTVKGELHTALDAFRADPAKGAQGLIDLHNKAIQDYAAQVVSSQHKAFNDTRSQWQKDVLADEEIGGAGHQTAMRAIARMRDLFVPEAERPAFDQFLRITGAGDHPQFLKLLHQAARYIDEPSMPPSGVRPPPNNGKPPGRRRDSIYDHPSSQKQRS